MFQGDPPANLSLFEVGRTHNSYAPEYVSPNARLVLVKGPPTMQLPGSLTYFLRNLGLEILAFDSKSEPTKVVVKKSLWVAFSRCLIHILPVTVSLVLLRLNLGGFYIGHGFAQQSSSDLTDQGNDVKLALIQVAAKVQVNTRCRTRRRRKGLMEIGASRNLKLRCHYFLSHQR